MTKQRSDAELVPISADQPLAAPEQDSLGYASFARAIARSLTAMPTSEGIVVAIYGPWGSGKTTVLNFIRHEISNTTTDHKPLIVEFNPWWFTGGDDLVVRFFATLRSSLERHKVVAKKILNGLTKLAGITGQIASLPGAGAVASQLENLGAFDLEGEKKRVVKALAGQERRIVVVIDDLDRLAGDEVRELFRVLKAVANFPNVTYLLAFDHDIVSKALQVSSRVNGAAYLEKIVQAPFHLPDPDQHALHVLFWKRLDTIIGDTPASLFSEEHWTNVFTDGIAPLLKTPRQVVRLANALAVTYPAVKGEVSPEDFAAVEALRIFRPEVYDIVRKNQAAFTSMGSSLSAYHHRTEALREFHNSWLQALPDKEHVKAFLLRLFPEMASVWGNMSYGDETRTEWRRMRRVCAPEVFPAYFRLTVPDASFSRRELLAILAESFDSTAFGTRLVQLSQEMRPDGMSRVSSFLQSVVDYLGTDTPAEQVHAMIAGVLAVGDALDLESDAKAAFGVGNDVLIMRLFNRLSELVEPALRASVLLSALKSASLATGLNVLRRAARDNSLFGLSKSEPGNRSALLDAATTMQLANMMAERIEVASRSPRELSQHRRFSYILSWWGALRTNSEPNLWLSDAIQDDEVLVNLLRAMTVRSHRRAIDSNYTRVEHVIDPETVGKFTDIEGLMRRVSVALQREDLGDDQREILLSLVRGKELRNAGVNPLGLFGPNDD